MEDRPEQLPEGRLIALAQKRARLSGRKAADRADMSEGHWRAIVSGSRSISAGVWVPVRAPAETLARMAQVVGVTPGQLEEAGRADAAEELRIRQGQIKMTAKGTARPAEADPLAGLPEDPQERTRVLHERLDKTARDTARIAQELRRLTDRGDTA